MKQKHLELQRQLELKNKMLESEQKINEVDSIVATVASDYRSIFFVNLQNDDALCYRAKSLSDNQAGDLEGVKKGDHFHFYEKITQYANKYIVEEDREKFLNFIKPENIREKIDNEIMINYYYMTIRDGETRYESIRIVNVNLAQNRYVHEVNYVSFGFADVDSETRLLLEKSHKMSEALKNCEEKTV